MEEPGKFQQAILFYQNKQDSSLVKNAQLRHMVRHCINRSHFKSKLASPSRAHLSRDCQKTILVQFMFCCACTEHQEISHTNIPGPPLPRLDLYLPQDHKCRARCRTIDCSRWKWIAFWKTFSFQIKKKLNKPRICKQSCKTADRCFASVLNDIKISNLKESNQKDQCQGEEVTT